MVPGCLMWIVWTKRNRRSFEDTEKSLVHLLALCQKTLLDWSRCWGFSECSTILEFISSLIIALSVFSCSLLLFVCLCFSSCSPSWTPCIAFLCFLVCFNKILITYQKKNHQPKTPISLWYKQNSNSSSILDNKKLYELNQLEPT